MSDSSKIEWKPIADAPGWLVSNDARMRGPRGRDLKLQISDSGHRFVQVRVGGRNGVTRKLYVHREMLKAFVGPCEPGNEGRHLDGDPAVNDLSRLAWGDRFDQREDDRRNGVNRRSADALAPEAVRSIRELRRQGISLRGIGAQFGVSHTTVRQIAAGMRYADVS